MNTLDRICAAALGCLCVFVTTRAPAADPAPLPRAFVDGTGPGWEALTEKYFVNVNCDTNTWTWTNGLAQCTGKPTGVLRSTVLYTNFELVAQWRHLRAAGNSGIILWSSAESIHALEQGKGRLP